MKKIFYFIFLLFVTIAITTVFFFRNKEQSYSKKNVLQNLHKKNAKTFDFLLTGEEDIPEFFPGYLDYEEKTGRILVLPRIFYSSILVIDKKRNYNLLGHRGQSPADINGRISTAKFWGENLIGLFSFFGETCFMAMNLEGDIVKKWPIKFPFGRVYEYKINGDDLYYADIVVLKNLHNDHGIINKISLSNPSKCEIILSIGKLKTIFRNNKIPFAEFLDAYFLQNSNYVVISPYEGKVNFSIKGEIPFCVIINLANKQLELCKVNSFFNSGFYSLKGINLRKSVFYVGEIVGKKKGLPIVVKGKVLKEEFLYNYGGVLHILDAKGQEKGVYVFYNDFYQYLLARNFSNFYITKIRGISQDEIICLGYLFKKNEKERKVIVLRAKIKKIS